MTSCLSLFATLVASVSIDGASSIVLDERVPMSVVLVTFRDLPSTIGVSAVLEAISRGAHEATDLFLLPEVRYARDDDSLSNCSSANLLSCWTRIVAEGGASHPDHPAYLLIVSMAGNRLATFFIDVGRAVRETQETADPQRSSITVENRIFEVATRSVQFREIADRAALDTHFIDLFERDFRDLLEEGAHYHPYGSIEVRAPAPGVDLELDDKPIGKTQANTTLISAVRGGRRKLTFGTSSNGRRSIEVVVRAREVVAVELPTTNVANNDPKVTSWRDVAFYGGAAVGAGGTTLLAYSLARGSSPRVLCPQGNCRAASGLASWCWTFAHDAKCLAGSKGALAAPIGYSLALVGAAWMLGAKFLDEAPWMTIAIGIAAGALSYGVSTAFDRL